MNNQRRIRFRAWDTKNKKFVNEVPSEEILLDNPEAEISEPDQIGAWENMFFYPSNPLGPTFKDRIIYQQYIGIKDKNNKDIYEGDIVKYKWESGEHQVETDIGEVFFEQGIFYFDRHNQLAANDCNFILESVEVIGNICENADLLQVSL